MTATRDTAGDISAASRWSGAGHRRTLPGLLARFHGRGAAPAIMTVMDGSEIAVSFRQLLDAAHGVAERIAALGVQPGDAVGLMAANGPAWIEVFWGIVAAGAVAMPFDLRAADGDVQGMVAAGGCRLIFADADLAGRLHRLVPSCTTVDLAEAAPAPPSPAPVAAEPPPSPTPVAAEPPSSPTPVAAEPPPPDPDDIAVLVFTSGTTGTPKPVPLSHANLLSNVEAILAEGIVGPGDRVLVPLPLHHTYPLTVGMLSTLATGATLVLPGGISGPQLVAAIRRCRATALLGVPRLYDALIANMRAEAGHAHGIAARLFSGAVALSGMAHRHLGLPAGRWIFRGVRARLGGSLRLMVSGGAALAPETEAMLDGLGWQVLTGYGLTETSPILTFNRPGRSRVGSAGQALPGVGLRIVDPDPDGGGGIEASGSSVFGGYGRDHVRPADAFTADGWFRTGDLGRLDADGHLFITARATETIVLPNGRKVYPETVEAAYAQAAPMIREIAVLRGGDGLVALAVLDEAVAREVGTLRLEERVHDILRTRARTLAPHLRLSGFAVTRQPLPRTQLGKLRRHLLPALYRNALEARRRPAGGPVANAAVPQNDPMAQAVWRWLRARYPAQRIDPDTSPQLDLGIDSLGWVDLTLALQRELGITLTEQQIARVMTIADLLREAAAAGPAGAAAVEIAVPQEAWFEPPGPWLLGLRLVGEALVRLTMRCVFRLHVEGCRRLPEPPFLLCPNHVSYLDPFALAAALPHRQLGAVYWAGWTGLLFSSRLRRLFSRAAQVIPIDPDHAAAAGLGLGVAVLAHGRTLVWFPEGALSQDGALQPFLPGVGAVLERMPVPVVPVHIAGTAAALPPGRAMPRLRRIRVRFGEAFDPIAAIPGPAGRPHQRQIADAIHGAVERLGTGRPS